MFYLKHPAVYDPAWNLACEEVLLTHTDVECFMLWQNCKSVIIGRNQEAAAEVNLSLAKQMCIPVFRRITGGGTVFHDEGNLNFSFLCNNCQSCHLPMPHSFYSVILDALKPFHIKAAFNGRNDLTVSGRKISGSAMILRTGRILFHGTLLVHSNLE